MKLYIQIFVLDRLFQEREGWVERVYDKACPESIQAFAMKNREKILKKIQETLDIGQ